MVAGTVPPRAKYFLSLSVQRVRCFGDDAQTLLLRDDAGQPARWTVLLGDNGTGKTTLLQLLAGFEALPFRTPGASNGGRPYSRAFLASVDHGTRFLRSGIDDGKATVEVAESHCLGTRANRVHCGPLRFFEMGTVLEASVDGPKVYGYGPMRRIGRSEISAAPDADGAASLFADSAELCNAEDWLLRLDYSASKESPIRERQQARRDQVRDILLKVLPDVTDIRFTEPSAERPTPTVEFQTPYGWVSLKGLGHGYRSMIAWVVDFASRMVERYPDAPDPLAMPAVVLVDEIDLHLHPKWQRQLISHLTRLFPNTQFIVTAHSPLIVQAAGDPAVRANIAVLRREGDHVVIDNNPQSIRNWRVDQILTSDLYDLPSARPASLDQKLARRTELLSKPDLTDADREEVRRIEAEIGPLPAGETADDARRMLKLAEEAQSLLRQLGGPGT